MAMPASAMMASVGYVANKHLTLLYDVKVPSFRVRLELERQVRVWRAASVVYFTENWNNRIARPSQILFLSQAIWRAKRKPRMIIGSEPSKNGAFNCTLSHRAICSIQIATSSQ